MRCHFRRRVRSVGRLPPVGCVLCTAGRVLAAVSGCAGRRDSGWIATRSSHVGLGFVCLRRDERRADEAAAELEESSEEMREFIRDRFGIVTTQLAQLE
jgi:hypothetical protein